MDLVPQGSASAAALPQQRVSSHDEHHGADPASLMTRIQALARAISTTSSVESLIRLIVLRTLAPLGCHGAGVTALDSTGMLRMVSTYGYPPGYELAEVITLDQKMPAVAALRSGLPVWVQHDDVHEFTDLHPRGWPPEVRTIVSFPLGDATASAVLFVTTCQRIEPNSLNAHYLETVASLMSVATDPINGRARLADKGRQRAALPGQLSERQIAILRLIADGRTNKAIGARLGYSESTVRHETMRIFRMLGVNSRSQAVTEALARGLISASTGEALDALV